MNLDDLQRLVAGGESETLEFKKTTGQLSKAGKTLCGFLNGHGGTVLFGVEPDGKVSGQLVSDTTLRDIASLHQRIGTTDSIMPQQRYQELLLNRMHTRSRWENQPARGFGVADLDEEEIQRTARLGISSGRMPETTGFDSIEILDRLGLRVEGQLLNAAIVIFGRRPLPHFPQCQLRMARFRGIDKTAFEDQRQVPTPERDPAAPRRQGRHPPARNPGRTGGSSGRPDSSGRLVPSETTGFDRLRRAWSRRSLLNPQHPVTRPRYSGCLTYGKQEACIFWRGIARQSRRTIHQRSSTSSEQNPGPIAVIRPQLPGAGRWFSRVSASTSSTEVEERFPTS